MGSRAAVHRDSEERGVKQVSVYMLKTKSDEIQFEMRVFNSKCLVIANLTCG